MRARYLALAVLALAGCSAEVAPQKAATVTAVTNPATFSTFPAPTTSTTLPQLRTPVTLPVPTAPARDWELEARLDRLERKQREQEMHQQICRLEPKWC